ncbi:hypothetical protein M5D96_000188 [Drosophila gunungcola]|uniref:Uncharacterized protein n=1 Tax=Drosophila gunungcola TaxID=103775 RepID=A0A9P9YWM8_9MUSC|nr:hypothetical protein M5D96_000188 [Drosophila gunungcola]
MEPPKFRLDCGTFASQLDRQSRLQFQASALRLPLSGIICTIGPSSNCPEVLLELMLACMRLVRISHGTHQNHCYVEQTGLPRNDCPKKKCLQLIKERQANPEAEEKQEEQSKQS